MKRKLLSINKIVRRRTNETIVEVRSITAIMPDMASETVHQANLMIKKLIPESKQDQALKLSLLQTIQAVEKVIKQTKLVNAGGKPEGIVTGYSVHKGNPSDKTLLVDVIEHHKKLFEKAPREIAVDEDITQKQMKMNFQHLA